MKKILLIFTAFLFLLSAIVPETSSADMARVHIIANSDSESDIEIKMKVADAVSELLSDSCFDSVESIETGLKERLSEIEEESNRILSRCGVSYSSKAEVGIRHFEKRVLANTAFPEGDYMTLTVTLGEGKGHNWWSVIFPEVSLAASLAMGEEGSGGKKIVVGDGSVVKIRCLIFDLYKFILTKE